MNDPQKLIFESRNVKRLFHRCQICGAEWPASAEYCRRCAVWLGPTCHTEDILWYVPAGEWAMRAKRNFSEGIYEATVLTIAACDSVYVSRSRCPELLREAAKEMLASGGVLTRSPAGHLTGCFVSRNPIENATCAVQCARSFQRDSEKYGIRTFIGINTGPLLFTPQNTQDRAKSQKKVLGGIIRCSEALAFSLYPRMIALSPATFRLVSSSFECYGTGPVHLWGTDANAPQTVYVVLGPKRVTSWKDRLEDNSVPLVGREKELRLLCDCWEEAKSGKEPGGITVHLVGEPGTGKSKLLQAFLEKISEAREDTVIIKLAGANYGGRPGLLLEEFVQECLREGIPSAKIMRLRPVTENEALRRLIPKSIPARVRFLSQMVTELGDHAPALIVIDDVHWADRESVKVFGKAFSTLRSRVMVIASYRPSASRLAQWLKKADTRQILLGPLAENEAKQISKLQSRGGEWISRSAWRELWKKSQGNPLYVEEATKLLLARREEQPDIAQETLPLPSTRAALLSARIREWGDREIDELRRELSLRWGFSVRSRLTRLETQVNDWLDRLETHGYLERTELAECLDELERFQNRVVEICLVGGLSRPLTTRLGEAISRLYEGSFEDHHRYLRQRGRVSEARPWVGHQALRVAERAVRLGKPEQAIRFFRIAEEMLPSDHPLRRDLLERAGDAQLLMGRTGEATRLYERALIQKRLSHPHDDLHHKLLAARLLKGEPLGLEPQEWEEDNPCPWHDLLRSASALLSEERSRALFFAQRAKEASSDWVVRSSAALLEAFVHLTGGHREGVGASCRQAVATMECGGLSLLSFGLHWLLSQVEEGPSQKRHMRTWKWMVRQLGMTSGFKAFRARLDFLGVRKKDEKRCRHPG